MPGLRLPAGYPRPAHAVEFRFRNGNSVWFPYNWLGNWKYDPSEGLLLKFSGDLVYLVLIRGQTSTVRWPKGASISSGLASRGTAYCGCGKWEKGKRPQPGNPGRLSIPSRCQSSSHTRRSPNGWAELLLPSRGEAGYHDHILRLSASAS